MKYLADPNILLLRLIQTQSSHPAEAVNAVDNLLKRCTDIKAIVPKDI